MQPRTLRSWPGDRGLVALLLLAVAVPAAYGQGVTGTSSLLTIPVGLLPEDGTVIASGGYVDARYSPYRDRAYVPYAASITFLPFLEVGLAFARLLDNPERQALGDRMVSLRVRALTERRMRPGVVLGVHDFLRSSDSRTSNFNALYLVATKHFSLLHGASAHLGYGSDILDAKNHQFVGVFGGVSVSPLPFADLLLEYDGTHVNGGVAVEAFRTVRLLAGLRHFSSPIAGLSVSYRL